MDHNPLIQISQDATLEASKALSKFVNAPLSLGTIRAEVHKDVDIPLECEPGEPVYAISCAIVGDTCGLAALCLPMNTAYGLCDLLFKREPGITKGIDADARDALLEMGNIVVGNYLRSFARAMPGTTLVHQTADMVCGYKAELTPMLLATWNGAGAHDALVFEVSFRFRHASLVGSVVILLEADRIRLLHIVSSELAFN